MISVRNTFTYLIFFASLFPVFIMSSFYIERGQSYLIAEKEQQLIAAQESINTTVTESLTNVLDLMQWFSSDRLVLQATNNLLLSSMMWRKMEQYKTLTHIENSLYVIDKEWSPVFQGNGSLYLFENSELFKQIKNASSELANGKILAFEYSQDDSPIKGSTGGIAFVSPLLAYKLANDAEYDPYGYMVTMLEYETLKRKIQPVLFGSEYVLFAFNQPKPLNNNEKLLSKTGSVDLVHSKLAHSISIATEYFYSNQARIQHIKNSKSKMTLVMLYTLSFIAVIIYLLNRIITKRFVEMEKVARSYQNSMPPAENTTMLDFTEFIHLKKVLANMFQTITRNIDELESKNLELQITKSKVDRTNRKLENFNSQLEQQVEQKTEQLRSSLELRAKQSEQLVNVLDYTGEFSKVSYRYLPYSINRHLAELLPTYKLQFHYMKREHAREVTSSNGKVQGYLSNAEDVINTEDMLLLELYIKQVASRLELESMARTDGLTQCLNRKAYEEDIEFIKSYSVQNNMSVRLIVIDLNGLKLVNDDFGHEYGDMMIVECKKVLASILPPNGNLYRIGGDEFVIVDVSEKAFDDNLFNDIRKIKHEFFMNGNRFPVEFAIGSASTQDFAFDELFRVADEAMYRNKERSNRVQAEVV